MFVTSVQDTEIIKEIVSSTRLPVNVVGLAETASISTLTDCGVKRVSMAVFYTKKGKVMTENWWCSDSNIYNHTNISGRWFKTG